ncbi:RidA family protein [Jeotgalibaca ciconiae]|uniref:RidA family protein n=1 Tax=Jeotgalibaca ciconiae TaxID=2496265 RepID=A0A3Q9BM50_9LACT|nr:Rid family detoxifying hydrolase [Jeotgalibaca ciconiae]AZP05395.1 RidA family protein [Jeotgalibaca ciconiae]HJB22730.1 Rid family detoxifying hydrolase [Candidatus Jeotgalibaca pullicola]
MYKLEAKDAPDALGPYSQAIVTGDLVFLSGQLGMNKEKGALEEGVEAQTKQAFKNIGAVLAEEKLTLDNVVKVTVLLSDINDFAKVNEVYATQFNEPYPARSAFAVKDIPAGGLVEIEVIASKSK